MARRVFLLGAGFEIHRPVEFPLAFPPQPAKTGFLVAPTSSPYPERSARTQWILDQRPDRSAERRALSVDRPSGWIEEIEPDVAGVPTRILTVFLTNRECPWRCLMCDLWRHTTLETVPVGAIPRQIRAALEASSGAKVLKLYNAGSFFDAGAIPPADHPAIAKLVSPFARVIVECHPLLVGPRVVEFATRLGGPDLEVALGLETAHPGVLEKLNKGMTVADFSRAATFLRQAGVGVRAFVLVKPPFLDEVSALEWAVRSARVAFEAGAEVVSLIPTRLGNGALEALALQGQFAEPRLGLLEEVFDRVLELGLGRVFADLWDLERFAAGDPTFQARKDRLIAMNLSQRMLPRIRGSATF